MKSAIPKKIPAFLSRPQKILASFIDPKSLLAKISDPKNPSDPPSVKFVMAPLGIKYLDRVLRCRHGQMLQGRADRESRPLL